MRSINVNEVKNIVKTLCLDACTKLNEDMKKAIENALNTEESPAGKAVLNQLLENAEIAQTESLPLCQDTGFTVIYIEIGQDVSFTGGYLNDAITEAVAEAYTDEYLRKSIVKNPVTDPENTGDNTPPIIHTDIVPGDKVKITVLPKGGGSENVSRIKMLKPADGIEGVRNFVIETVRLAGANPCPPIIVGVGIGGTFDYVAYLAKKALLRKIGRRNSDKKLAEYEVRWLEEINKLGIGPAGLGGKVTALDLFIEVFPRHIASFPVAVNIQCNASRSRSQVL
ncbi:MAG: fumarate hydratase [Planctomycetota bacterium]|jgi:fumarate hydratase subunit alpha